MKNLLLFTCLLLCVTACKKDNTVTPFTPTALTHSVVPADYLRSTDFDKLIVQVVYVEGMQPSQSSMDNLTAFLQARLNKPGGIQIVQKSIPSPGKSVYTLDDIKAIEKANRDIVATSRVLTTWIFFADGSYTEDTHSSKILGVTYTTGSIVIFENSIKAVSGHLGQPSTPAIETIAQEHEFGHILGLVNNGTAMVTPHQDVPHGQHCNNNKCLMYYNTETSDMIANLAGSQVPELDDNCLNDLKAAGGK